MSLKTFTEIERLKLAAFGSDLLAYYRGMGSDFFGCECSEDIMPIAVKHGLAERVPYDPKKHGEIEADPGDEIWLGRGMKMAWNPEPRVADCRDIARKWGGKEQVIIIAVDGDGRMDMATYGRTPQLCTCAKKLGDIGYEAITQFIEKL